MAEIKSNDTTITVLNELLSNIVKLINSSIDNERFNYSTIKSTKKIQNGSLVLNLRISSKDNTDKCEYLIFVLNRDIKTGQIHTFILDGDTYNPSMLFSTTGSSVIISTKLERYVPTIIASTQNMIK